MVCRVGWGEQGADWGRGVAIPSRVVMDPGVVNEELCHHDDGLQG